MGLRKRTSAWSSFLEDEYSGTNPDRKVDKLDRGNAGYFRPVLGAPNSWRSAAGPFDIDVAVDCIGAIRTLAERFWQDRTGNVADEIYL